jgi:hypothetical protein
VKAQRAIEWMAAGGDAVGSRRDPPPRVDRGAKRCKRCRDVVGRGVIAVMSHRAEQGEVGSHLLYGGCLLLDLCAQPGKTR